MGGVAVVSPHRAQCAALRAALLGVPIPSYSTATTSFDGGDGTSTSTGGPSLASALRAAAAAAAASGSGAAAGAGSNATGSLAGEASQQQQQQRRRQRQQRLPPAGAYRVVDTVEKLQGREAPAVIYSATASCPSALTAAADFYASLSRCNVALSRARRRLVVVVSRAMLSFAPGSVGRYRDLVLWKELRAACGAALGGARVGGARVWMFGGGESL